ncbi:RICIN domain-containing protein [Streptomyces sp. NPDC048411]|uniref:RICIN domain-containing protein n=1 Tax=Streptomyces sp. NPDC048411 TaxID=3157206 RepID=UPI003452A177
MTTSKPNDSPDEPTAVASVQAEAEGVGEAEGKPESAATMAERILTPARPPGRSAVPSAMAEPEPEPEELEEPEQREENQETEEAEADPEALGTLAPATASGQSTSTAEPAARTSADPKATADADTAGTADTADTAKANADADADTTAEKVTGSDDSTGDSARTAVKAAPGRPHKSLLAGAAIVGALLISVPFMISGGDGDDGRSSAKPGAAPGTVLESLAADAAPGVVGSESPSPHASKAKGGVQPKSVTTTTGPNGKPVVVTVTPKAGASGGGKKSTGGDKPVSVKEGSGKTSSGSGGTSGDTSSGSGAKSNNTSQTTSGESWSGGVQIYSHASGRCIGIANSPGAPVGSKLVIWDCYNESYQRWKFVDGTVRSEGKCMNVSGGATNNGAVINWTTCNGSGAQQFRLNSSHDLTNPQSGNKCVDVIDQRTDNGARLQLWQCAGTPNQKWSTRTP